jgi:hypothetical protein
MSFFGLAVQSCDALLLRKRRRGKKKASAKDQTTTTVNHATNHRFLIAFGKRLERTERSG